MALAHVTREQLASAEPTSEMSDSGDIECKTASNDDVTLTERLEQSEVDTLNTRVNIVSFFLNFYEAL